MTVTSSSVYFAHPRSLDALCVRRDLINSPGAVFIKHVYRSILKRAPEVDANAAAGYEFQDDQIGARVRYLFTVLTSDEALSQYVADYDGLLQALLKSLGYTIAADTLAGEIRDQYPTVAVFLADLQRIQGCIVDNTWLSKVRFEEAGVVAEEVDLALTAHALTDAVAQLNATCIQIQFDMKVLADRLSDVTAKLSETGALLQHSDQNGAGYNESEIMDLLAATLTQIRSAQR